MSYREDTVFAPSTAIGGAIAVIRVTGPDAFRVAELTDRPFPEGFGRMRFMRMSDRGEAIDDIMAVRFGAPHSYTGEDMVEINCHGGARTVQRVLQALSGLGFRPAEGGEFTRRAFLNGKMALSEAEAVMDIITAEAERSRKAAVAQLHGSVHRCVSAVEDALLDALSGVDAAIDYPDEAEAECTETLPAVLDTQERELRRLIGEGRKGRVLRDGLNVLILGRPNVGKSSLMNALTGHDRAIVTDLAGTTRDVLDEKVSFDGVPVRLIDTAGIRETDDPVEKIGVDRALGELGKADVLLLLLDGTTEPTAEDRELLDRTKDFPARVIVSNKMDLAGYAAAEGAVPVSAKNAEGLEALKQAVLALAAPAEGDAVSVTNERHIRALEDAHAFIAHAATQDDLDCAATDIREALHALGQITGRDVDAEVIDRIFSRFCVGK
ncbi:MAG: tRNA uridine-5-carboxymethylaminomethyl(34) synthesis GTPase MnmE [Clostridia bacterium]|nr:tRNA uridine-5-carboxymethylaminomethyl(34) synthesis GTPase MnmE [Clostridia bacterium]